MSDLTEKQEAFCRNMAADITGNGTRAALGAGCSKASAAVTASKWLKLPKIVTRIAELRNMAIAQAQEPAALVPVYTGEVMTLPMTPAEVERKVEGAAADVIRELQWIAHSDLTALFDHCKGDLITVTDLKALPPEVRRVVKSIKVKTRTYMDGKGDDAEPVTEVTYELSLWPKDVALNTLAKHHGLLKDIVETRDLNVAEALKLARQMAGV